MIPSNDSTVRSSQDVQAVKKRMALIVDDGEVVRQSAGFLLLRKNFDIATASDGYLGLQIAIQLIPDIIILDIWMPQLDGLQVLHVLKSQERTKSIPVIVITGLDDQNKIQEALSLGAKYALRKPVEEQLLISILRDTFGSEFDTAAGDDVHNKEIPSPKTAAKVEGIDEEMLTFLKKQFILLYIPRLKKIMEYVESHEVKDLHRLVHDIKGSAGTVGYSDVTQKAASVESMLKNEPIDWTAVGLGADILQHRIEEIQLEIARL